VAARARCATSIELSGVGTQPNDVSDTRFQHELSAVLAELTGVTLF